MVVDGNDGNLASRRELDEYARSGGTDRTLENVAELARRVLGCAAVTIGLADGSPSALSSMMAGGPLPAGALSGGGLTDPVRAHDLGLRFYAGIPLRAPDGRSLGTLAALDPEPRDLGSDDLAALRLAASVAAELIGLRSLSAEGGPSRPGRAVR